MNRRGFTLMELLIVMTLLSLLLVALFGGLRFMRANEGRAEALIAAADRQELTRSLLERQLAALLPLMAGEEQQRHLLFTGLPDRLAFPIARLPGQGPAGLMLAVFDIERIEGGKRLVYREYPFLPGGKLAMAEQPTRSSPLLTAPDLAFRYDGTGGWQSQWSDGARLPDLVGLSATGGPDLVARPRAEAGAP